MSAIPRIAILASSLLTASAFAGPSPQTGTFDVTATVAGSCNIIATETVAFGQYDPADANLTAALDAAGSVTVRCVRGTLATVALDEGNSAAAGSSCAAPLRQMAAGTDRLAYQLFQDSARTQPWGCDTGNNTQAFTAASPSTPTVLTTYGRVSGGQDVTAGDYSDTVTVTVTF